MCDQPCNECRQCDMPNPDKIDKENEMNEWFGKGCEHQACQWEETEITGGPDYKESLPNLIFCSHKGNADECEGNCNEALCPISAAVAAAAGDDMFEADSKDTVAQIDEFAQGVCLEMEAVEQLYKEHSRRKEALDAAKEQLNRILTEAGMESCKLECGLNPRTKTNRRIFKAKGVDDDQLFDWLRGKDLGDIIKPTVHHGTLNSTMKEYEQQGNELPESVFNVSVRPTITMGGKTAFLAKQ